MLGRSCAYNSLHRRGLQAAVPWRSGGYALDDAAHGDNGGTEPPHLLQGDDYSGRGRDHQPGQPATGMARVQDGGEKVTKGHASKVK